MLYSTVIELSLMYLNWHLASHEQSHEKKPELKWNLGSILYVERQ